MFDEIKLFAGRGIDFEDFEFFVALVGKRVFLAGGDVDDVVFTDGIGGAFDHQFTNA